MELKIIYKDLDELTPYVNNPKEHPEEQIDKIIGSIREFGFRVPLLIKSEGTIIAGHGRYKALKKMGWDDQVPCVVADDLTENQIKAFRLADNRVTESDWDPELLDVELRELDNRDFDLSLTGFDDEEIDDILLEDESDDGVDIDGEMEFTTEVMESNQYVVFYFDNEMDFNVVKDFFGLGSVHALDSEQGYERKGVGRVLNGNELLDLIEGVR